MTSACVTITGAARNLGFASLCVLTLRPATCADGSIAPKDIAPIWETQAFYPTAVAIRDDGELMVGDFSGGLQWINSSTGETRFRIVGHGKMVETLVLCVRSANCVFDLFLLAAKLTPFGKGGLGDGESAEWGARGVLAGAG